MKIHCPKQLLEALQKCDELRSQHMSLMSRKCWDLFNLIKDNDEAVNLLNEIHKEFQEYRHLYVHETLPNILMRQLRGEMQSQIRRLEDPDWKWTYEVNIYSDHTPLCFGFSETYLDGSTGIVGGIIYHGCPDEGYQQNYSVQLDPHYGWSQHT